MLDIFKDDIQVYILICPLVNILFDVLEVWL